MKDKFYRAFEERYRGSRENIKQKQKVYLPFVQPLHIHYPDGIVIDLGCGRGEWLELMRDHHIPAKGIDLDQGMLDAGQNLGLDVVEGDGILFLKKMKDESAIIITAFHVIEHISFDQLQELVSEAQRVLKPGGILILETPNPENIRVASETFYLDPTHTRPIPSGLLSFTTEYHGFLNNKVIRLQESELLSAQKYANIGQVIEGSSPDYAVIAQKEGPAEIIASLAPLFSAEYGLSLSDLIEKFERRMIRFEELVDKIFLKTAKAEEFAWKAEVETAKAQELARNADESARNADENARNAWIHYQAVVNSYSWKLALPLRLAEKMARRLKNFFYKITKASLTGSKQILIHSPKLNNILHKVLNRFPRLKLKLKKLVAKKQIEYGTQIDAPKFSFPDVQTVSSDLEKTIKKEQGE